MIRVPVWVVVLASLTGACGKRGSPLPPLVRLPAAPADLIAERRGDTVNLRFAVPRVNTDDSRPANVARVDIYALTGPLPVTDEDLIKRGTRVATVPVKTPRDPNETIEPGEPDDALSPLVGDGLDQGAVTGVRETLAPGDAQGAAPGAMRTYVGVGVTSKGRMGPFSTRVAVPLVAAPGPPSGASATYDERTITLTWRGVPGSGAVAYNVYEVPPLSAPGASGSTAPPEQAGAAETRLTGAPLPDTRYSDGRMTWGMTRCYVVRAVLSVDALAVEGDGAAPACVTLTDTFPPAVPTGLQGVAGEGTISLIWDANAERDLDGYIVLRAARPGDLLTPITPSPIRETTFRDPVQAGTLYVYAVAAVDRAGNVSLPSNRVEETAR